MRILVLSKRQYLGKDLIDDRFFRNYEIPEALIARGHEVQGLALSYRRRRAGEFKPGAVSWRSHNLFQFPQYWSNAKRELRAFAPDVVWSSSDMIHGVIAHRLCRHHSTPFVIDMYDNYESFGLSRLPGLAAAFQHACCEAAGLSVISGTLNELLKERRGLATTPRLVLGNAVRRELFVPGDRVAARRRLGLPETGRFIGTAGALYAGRGIDLMFRVFERLARSDDKLYLVIAGQRDGSVARFTHPRLIDLGMRTLEQVPLIYQALNVAIICNLDSEFGRYCFPQKLYEIVCCRTPLVAAAVGETKRLLIDHPHVLFTPSSERSMAERVTAQLQAPRVIEELDVADWGQRAQQLEAFLTEIVNGSP